MTASVSRDAGGLYQSIRGLAKASVDLNRSITVIGVKDKHTDADIADWAPVPIQAFPSRGPERFSYAPEMFQAIRKFDFDILQLHGLWRYPSIVANQWHRETRKPYIVHPHGMLDSWAVRNSRWKKVIAGLMFENRMLKNAACLRALCQSEAESIRRYGLNNPICVIPNGMELPSGPYADAPWKAHLPQDAKILFYIGRLHPKKGLPNLLKAWSEALKTKGNGKWVLVIAGWDEIGHEKELIQLASDVGIDWKDIRNEVTPSANSKIQSSGSGSPSLLFIGPQFKQMKAACYHHSDAFILPSFSEGLPMVILEAWSHGKPVLMTPECNLPEGFAGHAGLKIETKVESITGGLQQLFKMSEPELDQIGRNGRQLVAEQFDWNKIAEDLHAVCYWISGRGAKPDCIYKG